MFFSLLPFLRRCRNDGVVPEDGSHADVASSRRVKGQELQDTLEEWLPRLTELRSCLGGIAGETEEEFLTLGAKLQEFVSFTEQMSHQSSRLTSLTAGQGEDSAIEEAKRIFHDTLAGLKGCGEELATGLSLLGNVEDRYGELSRIHGDLHRTARMIRMLGVAINIESVRADGDGAGFKTLGKEIVSLASSIEENSQGFREGFETTKETVERFSKEMKQRVESFRQGIEGVERHISGVFETYARLAGRAALVSQKIAGRSSEISQQVGIMVASMQFHDITRQRLEHVDEAIEDLCTRIEDGAPNITPQAVREPIAIQVAQLKDILAEVNTAGGKMVSALNELATQTAEQAEDALNLGGNGGADGATVAGLKDQMVAISSALSESAAVSGQMIEVVGAVSEAAQSMGKFVKGIEQIGDNIRFCALNALASSTRTGAAGKALAVLAKEIHAISLASEAATKGAALSLRSMIEVAGRQDLIANSLMVKQKEAAHMMKEAEKVAELLHDVEDETQLLARELDGDSRRFSLEVSQLTQGICFPATIADQVGNGISVLEELSSREVLHVESDRANEALDATLDTLASRYTMSSERDVHMQASAAAGIASATSGRAEPLSDAAAFAKFSDNSEENSVGKGDGGQEDLGDNVELF